MLGKIKTMFLTQFFCVLTCINPEWNIRMRYFQMYKRRFPDKKPTTFSEKLLWLRIHCYNNSSFVAKCADKVLVREYVKEKGWGMLLNGLVCQDYYSDVNDIPWEQLPTRFAMKWNFGATFNFICTDKSKIDIELEKKKMEKWGRKKYHLPYAEMQYARCEKKILIEEYLDTNQGFLPYDYKLYCFNGKCKAILVIADRDGDKKGAFFTPEWDYIGVPGKKYNPISTTLEKPKGLSTMVECAESLSTNIPFVRCDFFDYNGKPIFGEMTFSPASGLMVSEITLNGVTMGELLDISTNTIEEFNKLG